MQRKPSDTSREVSAVDPKMRILAIRLMESLRKRPAWEAALGVEVRLKKARAKAAASQICRAGGLTEL